MYWLFFSTCMEKETLLIEGKKIKKKKKLAAQSLLR